MKSCRYSLFGIEFWSPSLTGAWKQFRCVTRAMAGKDAHPAIDPDHSEYEAWRAQIGEGTLESSARKILEHVKLPLASFVVLSFGKEPPEGVRDTPEMSR